MFKLWVQLTKSHQISTSCTEMIQITLLKSKLRSSNRFGNANVTIEDRRQITGESLQKLLILTA